MRPILDPFQPGATVNVRVLGRRREHSMIVFDGGKSTIVDHPVASADRCTLVVQDRIADLTRIKPKFLAARLLGLPGVLPDDQRGAEYCTVPLVEPDQLLDDALITTWTINDGLRVDQRGSSYAELILGGRHEPQRGTITRDLHGVELWLLARVLVSLDVWLAHLRGACDEFARAVRRARETGPARVQVFHLREDRLVEVFSYADTTERGIEGILDAARLLAEPGRAGRGAEHWAAAGRRLEVGDMVAVDGMFFVLGPDGWAAFAGRPRGF